jgi:hypothetical protein
MGSLVIASLALLLSVTARHMPNAEINVEPVRIGPFAGVFIDTEQ